MYYIESCVACKSKRIIKLYKDVQDRHYRIRGKYTLYKCKQCGKAFACSSSLTNHEKKSNCRETP